MPGRPDSPATRALAWLYAPAAQRAALAALCALEREIAASLRPGLDHQLAHTRLAWWREECERSAQGQPQHPLTRELAALCEPAAGAPLAGLVGLVDTAVWDLAAATFATRGELRGYCERWSGAMIAPLATLATRAAALDAAAAVCAQISALGAQLRELELLLALAPDARAGRLRLPLAELDAAQVASESLARPPWPESLATLVRGRHGQLRNALTAGVAALPPPARVPLRGLIVWVAIACGHSARAERLLPAASATREPRQLSDGWRAWRAARRVDIGRSELTHRV